MKIINQLLVGLFFALIGTSTAHAAASNPGYKVLQSYDGGFFDILNHWKMPSILENVARDKGKKLSVTLLKHEPYLTALFHKTSFAAFQNDFFSGQSRDKDGIIKLQFFEPYIDVKRLRKMLIEEAYTHIIIPGGHAVSPFFYGVHAEVDGEDYVLWRDVKEMTLILLAKELGIPVMAICRGMQLTNILFGGTINHRIMIDIAKPHQISWNLHKGSKYWFPPKHGLYVIENSLMAAASFTQQSTPIRYSDIGVTSIHQHSLTKISPHFRVTAFLPIDHPENNTIKNDQAPSLTRAYAYREGFDVVEAIEYKGEDFFLFAPQFHPEYLDDGRVSKALFSHFLSQKIRTLATMSTNGR